MFPVLLLFNFKEQDDRSALSEEILDNSLLPGINSCFMLTLSLMLDESSGLKKE